MQRKNQPRTVQSLLLVTALLAIVGGGLYLLLVGVVNKLNEVNSDLAKALITGAVTIFAAAIALILGKAWEQRVKIQQDVREKKIPVYEEQIATFFSLLLGEKAGASKPSEHEIQKAFLSFTEKLLIWGSPEVIRKWSAFRLHDWTGSNASLEGFLKLEQFVRAIRVDVGSSNSGLPTGELMKLFVNDLPSLPSEMPGPPTEISPPGNVADT